MRLVVFVLVALLALASAGFVRPTAPLGKAPVNACYDIKDLDTCAASYDPTSDCM